MKSNPDNKEQKLHEQGMLENGITGHATYDQSWRPKEMINAIASLPTRPGYTRKGVIINYKHLPKNLENHEAVGYQVVYSVNSMTDERKFSPNSNTSTGNTTPAPVLQRTADGYQMVVMEIEDSKLQALKEAQAKEDHERHMRSVKSVKRQGNTTQFDGGEEVYNPNSYK